MIEYPEDSPIAHAIERFRRAFKLAGIKERTVKVTWDMEARWCRFRFLSPSGKVMQRALEGKPAEELVQEMSVWAWRAALRSKVGGIFEDESCVEVPPEGDRREDQGARR